MLIIHNYFFLVVEFHRTYLIPFVLPICCFQLREISGLVIAFCWSQSQYFCPALYQFEAIGR